MNATARAVVIHLNAAGEPSPAGVTYWEVTETYDPADGRTTYGVTHDGWLTAGAYRGPSGWRVCDKPRETIPAPVLALLPDGAVAALCVAGGV